MRHDRIAEAGSGTRAEIHHALGHARFFEQLDKLCGDRGGIARRLQDDGVATDDRCERHPSINAQGKFHGGMTAPTPSGTYISVSRPPGSWMGVCALEKRRA